MCLATADIGEIYRRHRSVDFTHFLAMVEGSTPAKLGLNLMMDNVSIHKTTLIRRWLLRHPRVHLHFMPTSSSLIKLVECWFSIISALQLSRGRFHSTRALESSIRGYIAENNLHPKLFVWTKSSDDILDSLAAFCQRISNSHH